MLSCIEYEKSFITSEPVLWLLCEKTEALFINMMLCATSQAQSKFLYIIKKSNFCHEYDMYFIKSK